MKNSNNEKKIQTGLLLDWYDTHRRHLPWREDPTPYHVWVSEIMLQQTRVDTVIPYYERFMEQLPDVAALAAAEEEQYLKLWEGLGYYSRVRNMHEAACQIMELFGGRIPDSVEELQSLKGIGKYTSEAIASIAYQVPVPSVDGNFLRVFARMTMYAENIRSSGSMKKAEAYFTERISPDRPGDFNQAVMDLGATVCLPNGSPNCGSCPWEKMCLSHREKRELDFPVLPEKKKRKKEELTALLIRQGDHVLLQKRPDKALLAGMTGFPCLKGTLDENDVRQLLERAGIKAEEVKKHPSYVHIFSHREWAVTVYEIRLFSSGDLSVSRWEELTGCTGLFSAEQSQLFSRYSIPAAFSACLGPFEDV